jgi:hypothetical protein
MRDCLLNFRHNGKWLDQELSRDVDEGVCEVLDKVAIFSKQEHEEMQPPLVLMDFFRGAVLDLYLDVDYERLILLVVEMWGAFMEIIVITRASRISGSTKVLVVVSLLEILRPSDTQKTNSFRKTIFT